MNEVRIDDETRVWPVSDTETMTSFLELEIPELGIEGDVRTYTGDTAAEFYAEANCELHARTPRELHELADRITRYAATIHTTADRWATRIADGTIPAREAV
ncbi:hypothetical protein BAAM0483_02885 [Bifidobacterium animalis subsp. animalis MCC 0483]|uniref:Uncharacterized protein n=1 Tax=Bifidobacterium animalis subsp. animalis MCC 0483 TaxID=1365955 RepID=A0AB34TAI3_9BIFI|nr:hypothetical protein [Bifidobacterium animalis]KOA51160.1 hypothetical protein BAAM0483_02885 [Bifidobacterium animalis subsp. animalis MCC 0483]